MAEIKKSYNSVGEQIYLQTHEKAVVDSNGTTAETKFQTINQLVQQAQMEVGAVPSDLTPTPNSTNWVTSGGVRTALDNIEDSLDVSVVDKSDVTVEQGYVQSSNSTWKSSSSMSTWRIENFGYHRIKVHVRNNDTGAYALSFFSSSTISSSTKIASYTHSGSAWDDLDVLIPDNTSLIVVTTRGSYEGSSYFNIYDAKFREVQSISDRVTTLETEHAIEPIDFIYFWGGKGYSNSNVFDNYANLIADPRKHLLSDYLINGKLVIWNNYTGENQVKCKIPFWNSSGGYASYNAWTTLAQGANYITPNANATYFSICFGMNNSGGTEINASSPSLYSDLFYGKANIYNEQVVENIGSIQELNYRLDVIGNGGNGLTLTKPTASGTSTTYFGKKFEFGNKYSVSSYNIATGGNQAGALYGDLLFVFNANRKNCFIVDMNTKAIVQNISLEEVNNFHCNQVQFGTQKYDSSDPFPLLYVDSLYLKNCQVFRITVSEGVYSLTLVQTITYPSSYSNPEAFIDRDRNLLWVAWEYGGTPSSSSYNGTIRLQLFSMPTLAQGDVTLSAESSTTYVDVQGVPVMQGGMIMDGKAYIGTGYTGQGRIYVNDLYCSKQLETMIHFGTEAQSCFFWDDHLWYLSSGSVKRINLW